MVIEAFFCFTPTVTCAPSLVVNDIFDRHKCDRQRLVSVGSDDAIITPNKEIRFRGPGNKTEIVHVQIDVYRGSEEKN